MIEFLDHIAGEGKQGRRKIVKEDGTVEFVTIELADEAEHTGTPINRDNIMALQGFIGMTTEKLTNGDILQTTSKNETLLTHKNEDGSITQIFTGEKVITKTIKKVDGKIVEVTL